MADDADPKDECQLMAGSFSNFIQFVLFLIVMSVLFLKRHLEKPQRPVKIWLLDVGKQIVGGGEAHVLNMLIAGFLKRDGSNNNNNNKEDGNGDECQWYFVNFALDTSIGVLLNIGLLKLLTIIATKKKWKSLMVSGDYGSPISYRVWAIQLLTWTMIIPLVKIILLVVILFDKGVLGNLGHILLDWLHPTPKIELVVVMIICPCLMNLFQYWIQDLQPIFLPQKLGNSPATQLLRVN